jgi:DnaB-like helicase N terminal domain/AAA domain
VPAVRLWVTVSAGASPSSIAVTLMPSDSRSRTTVDNPPPQNIDAERSILGAVLLDSAALAVAAKNLCSADFFHTHHQLIFRHMLRLADAGAPIELLTLSESLHKEHTIETAGGDAYLASLADGMPKVSNVEHYAKIVKEKCRLREIIRATHDFQQQAWDKDGSSTQILADLSEFLKMSGNGHGSNSLIAVDVLDFLTMKLDPIDFVIEPILPVSNSAMIFAPTGVGKTYIMLYMAYSVAIGAPGCFVWDIPRARPVVYVDGEMDQLTLQERQTEIARSFHPVYPVRGNLKLITPDQQPKYPPRINTKEGRARIEEHFQPGCLVILDNIVTLCPGGDEKESEDWSVIQEWILYLRRNHISLFMVQHAGKSGDQIGTSKKEIQLSCNIKLRNQNHYTPEDGLRVEARLTKLRRRGKDGRWDPRWAQPFEIAYRVADGAAEFSTRPMKGILKQQAVELLVAGAHPKEVMEATGLDRFVVYRLKKTIKDSGIAAAQAEE